MDDSPIARLPAELRAQIYALVLKHDGAIEIVLEYSPKAPFQIWQYQFFGLAKTCKAMAEECIPIFYSINTFLIFGRRSKAIFEKLNDFCQCIGVANTAFLRDVVLDIGTLEFDSFESACDSYDKLQTFLARVAEEKSSGRWNCRFVARVLFRRSPLQCPFMIFSMDWDFDDIEKSWDKTANFIKERIAQEGNDEGDREGWQKFLLTIETSRTNLRNTMTALEDASV